MNLFGLTSLIIFLSAIGFGLLIYRTDRKSSLNKSWLALSISIGFWGLGLYGVTCSNSENTAMMWQNVLDVSAIFIPATFFLFVTRLIKENSKIYVKLFFILSIILSISSFSSLYKVGMNYDYGFWWIEPGQYYIIFPLYYLSVVIFCVYKLIKTLLITKDVVFKAQLRNTLFASLLGFGGGVTNFFPQVLDIYPYGNYLVILYIFFMSYGVLKYKLLSAKAISVQLFSGAMMLVFLFNLLQEVNSLNEWIIKFVLFVFVSVFGILLVQSVNKEISQREKIELLATDLQKANDRLTELDIQKSEFVSFATHQLRAPLTAMKGYASLILEGDVGEVGTGVKDAVSRIFESAKTLASIVDDYLNITRIELGTMKYAFDTVDFKSMVEDVIAELKPNITSSKAKFEFIAQNHGSDYHITADRDKLKQVIANLVDNSIKYTPTGSVKVSISRDTQKNKVIFEVKDTGIGIAPEVLPHLFAKFSRAGNANKTNIKGTGLGLFVAKEIVKSHHGEIYAESAGEGKGSRFVVEFDPFWKA